MKRFTMLLALASIVIACGDSIGPDPFARKHVIRTEVFACLNSPAYDLKVSWVNWNWQAIFLKGAQQVANVTDSSLTHSSGCVYALGDKARVKLVPLGDITKYLDSAFVDVDIK